MHRFLGQLEFTNSEFENAQRRNAALKKRRSEIDRIFQLDEQMAREERDRALKELEEIKAIKGLTQRTLAMTDSEIAIQRETCGRTLLLGRGMGEGEEGGWR